jgi:universal stress protein E
MRILCATDLLPKSEAAIERAGMMAARLRADLSLLHVVVPSQTERALENDLERAIAHMQSRSRPPLWQQADPPDVIVKTGSPASRTIETIDEAGAKLVVIGPHRRRATRSPLSGTIAEKLLSSRAAPVLIVKRPPRETYRKVIVALDLSATSGLALRAAESFVVTEDTHAVIVHAFEPYYEGMLAYSGFTPEVIGAYSMRRARDVKTVLRDWLERETRDPARYDILLEQARPDAGIRVAADRLDPDLLVLGTRGHGPLRRALLGSVANQMLTTATCDVLIVPDGSVQAPARRKPATIRKRIRVPFNEVIPGA